MVILVLTASSGCLWSPDIQEAEGEALHPPEIVLEQLTPPVAAGFLTIEDPCAPFLFKVGTVRERNLRDVLYIRWYVDFLGKASVPPVRDLYLAPSGGEERNGSPQLDWSVIADGQSSVWKQAVHTVTVFVADRPYANQPDPEKDPIVFADPEAQYDTWQWTFQVAQGITCE